MPDKAYHIAVKFDTYMAPERLPMVIETIGDQCGGVHTETTSAPDGPPYVSIITIRYNFITKANRNDYVLHVMDACNEVGSIPTIIADIL